MNTIKINTDIFAQDAKSELIHRLERVINKKGCLEYERRIAVHYYIELANCALMIFFDGNTGEAYSNEGKQIYQMCCKIYDNACRNNWSEAYIYAKRVREALRDCGVA